MFNRISFNFTSLPDSQQVSVFCCHEYFERIVTLHFLFLFLAVITFVFYTFISTLCRQKFISVFLSYSLSTFYQLQYKIRSQS